MLASATKCTVHIQIRCKGHMKKWKKLEKDWDWEKDFDFRLNEHLSESFKS